MKSLMVTSRHIYFLQCPLLVKSISLTSRHEFCFPHWVSSFWGSRFCWPRGTKLFLAVLFWNGIDLLDPEARVFVSLVTGVLILVEPILLTSRYEFISYSALCSGIDVLDPEARVYFLQCTSFGGVDIFDPEARVYFLQWITLWHPDSGPVDFFLQQIHWHFFCVCTKSYSFPVEWFPASKVLESDQAFPCLGIGQNGPHLASGIMLLPCCGWCLWSPPQVTWPRSATVVSPDPESRIPTFEILILFLASTLSLSHSWFWLCPLIKEMRGGGFKSPGSSLARVLGQK